jgi:hypothetical protein
VKILNHVVCPAFWWHREERMEQGGGEKGIREIRVLLAGHPGGSLL